MQHQSNANHSIFIAYLCVLISSLIYGGNVIAGRLIAGEVTPLVLSFIRAFMALILILPLSWSKLKKAPKPNAKELWQLFIIGMLGITIPYIALIVGLKYATGTNASIVFATLPVITNVLIFIIYKTKPSIFQGMGIILAFFGLLVVFTHGAPGQIFSLKLGLGEMILFINVFSIAFFSIFSQRVMEKFSSQVTSIYALIFGTLTLAPLGLWEFIQEGWNPLSPSSWGLLIYMGVLAAGIAFFLNLHGINKIGSGQVTIFNNLQHVFSIILSALILKEAILPYHLLGFSFVLGGVFLSLKKTKITMLSEKF